MRNSLVVFAFFFRLGILFLGKFDPKSQNCQFKLKFGAYTNGDAHFSTFDQENFVGGGGDFSKVLKLFVEAEIWNLE